jgi:hypothetical protein
MVNRKVLSTVCAVAVCAAALIQHPSAAPNAQRTTRLTFSQPVKLPGIALGAGTYIFELAAPDAGSDVVRVLSRDRTQSFYMGFTRVVDRPSGISEDKVVSLGEAAAGEAPPITAWWPKGDSTGRQFIYAQAR